MSKTESASEDSGAVKPQLWAIDTGFKGQAVYQAKLNRRKSGGGQPAHTKRAASCAATKPSSVGITQTCTRLSGR